MLEELKSSSSLANFVSARLEVYPEYPDPDISDSSEANLDSLLDRFGKSKSSSCEIPRELRRVVPNVSSPPVNAPVRDVRRTVELVSSRMDPLAEDLNAELRVLEKLLSSD